MRIRTFKYSYIFSSLLLSLSLSLYIYIYIYIYIYMGHCWRIKDELISDILFWTPSHKRVSVWWPTITYLQQLCADKGRSLEELPEVMDDRDGYQDRVRKIHVSSMTWLFLYIYIYIYIYIYHCVYIIHIYIYIYIYVCVCVF